MSAPISGIDPSTRTLQTIHVNPFYTEPRKAQNEKVKKIASANLTTSELSTDSSAQKVGLTLPEMPANFELPNTLGITNFMIAFFTSLNGSPPATFTEGLDALINGEYISIRVTDKALAQFNSTASSQKPVQSEKPKLPAALKVQQSTPKELSNKQNVSGGWFSWLIS